MNSGPSLQREAVGRVLTYVEHDPTRGMTEMNKARTLTRDQRAKRLELGKLRREATRRKIVDAACNLFSSSGYDLPSVDDIILQAEVGRGSFYNHFSSREDVFSAACNDISSEIHERIGPVLNSIADPAERICTAFRLFVRCLVAQRQRALLFLRTAPLVNEINNASEQYYEKSLREGMASGRFTLQDEPLCVDLTMGLAIACLRRVLIEGESVEYVDRTAYGVLMFFGVGKREARQLANAPLPGER